MPWAKNFLSSRQNSDLVISLLWVPPWLPAPRVQLECAAGAPVKAEFCVCEMGFSLPLRPPPPFPPIASTTLCVCTRTLTHAILASTPKTHLQAFTHPRDPCAHKVVHARSWMHALTGPSLSALASLQHPSPRRRFSLWFRLLINPSF